jgi:hypothetical protein
MCKCCDLHDTSTIHVRIRRAYSRPRPQDTKRVKRSGESMRTVFKERNIDESRGFDSSLTLLELFKVTTTVATSRRATVASLIVFETFIVLLLLFKSMSWFGTFKNNESNCEVHHRLIAICCLGIRPSRLLIQDCKIRFRRYSEVPVYYTWK